jgi:hypothetical protein
MYIKPSLVPTNVGFYITYMWGSSRGYRMDAGVLLYTIILNFQFYSGGPLHPILSYPIISYPTLSFPIQHGRR